jgi:hypothetical protein
MRSIAAFLVFSLCAYGSIFAQKQIPVSEPDTFLNRKIVKIESDLLFPKLIYPLAICDSLHLIFNNYLYTHQEIIVKYDLLNGNANHDASIWFEIDTNGKIININHRKFYTPLDSFVRVLFLSFLQKTQWKPFHKKNTYPRKYMTSRIEMFVRIYNKKIILIQFEEMENSKIIFKCK